MAFPDTPLGVQVDLQVGGVWAKADTYTRDAITITRGQSDEATVADPSRCTVTLNNKDGKYSPRNPASPYYGLIGRNTPIRITVPGVESYLTLDGALASSAETPDHASLDITGDLDIRVEAEVADWVTGAYHLLGKWGSAGNQSYRIQVEQSRIYLLWTSDGTTLQFRFWTVPTTLPRRTALRATLDVNDPSGGNTAEFFVAASLDGPWTSLGTVSSATPTSIYNSTATVRAGGFQTSPDGRVYRGQIRSGIGGTVVAAPDMRALTPGTTAWTDTAGRPWSVTGAAAVSNRAVRYVGEVSSWPPRWAPSGQDVWVSIEGSGILRRLGQGKKALESTLRRRLPSRSPLAYWPCEEDRGATQAYSPLTGGSPLAVSGWEFGQDDTLDGSAPLPVISPGGTMRGRVPVPSVPSTTWAICMPYRVDGAAPVVEQEVLSWTTMGTVRRWRITMGASVTRVRAYDVDGAEIANHPWGTGTNIWFGWWRLEFSVSQSGGNIAYRLGWTKVGGSASSVTSTIPGTVGAVTGIDTSFGPGLPDIRIGHLTVWSSQVIASAYDSADKGFTGESAIRRLRRLSAEESQTARVGFSAYVPDTSTRMGPQRPDTLMSLLQQCADSDLGILTEAREAPTLVYRPRELRYNQPPKLVLDYAAGDVAPPMEPVDDDQATRNDITVTRIGGSSARAVQETGPMSIQAPPLGVGQYDDSTDLSLATDDLPEQIANWLLHLGTWDESRVPTVRVRLHKRPALIPAVLGLELGDRIQIINTPSWLPPGPIDLIVQGITETLGVRTWDVDLTCVPAGPWSVGVLDDPVLGRVDTDGTTLGAAVSASDTSLLLVSGPGAPWITTESHPTDFPVDLQVGGEVVRATAIRGVIADSFGRTEASGWGAADSGQPWTRAGGVAADFAVSGGVGTHAGARGTLRATTVPVTLADIDLRTDVSMSAVPAGGTAEIHLMARRLGSGDFYTARLLVAAGGAITLSLRRFVGGTETQLATYTTGLTLGAGTWYTLRLSVQGSALAAKVWARGGVEPAPWQVSATDTSLTLPGVAGLRTLLGGTTTNTLPLPFSFDNVISLPQQATVIRSVNGIVKSHAAGAAVSLAHPVFLAL
ncbi:hypothetical protein ACFUJU_13430 [Streptomyces sp. NPDC057235]|uniref:hypothetical protein n=1 Tax=Streptomyces sp. NPDC057235 TaxID=3346058 RepID=UPI00362EE98F